MQSEISQAKRELRTRMKELRESLPVRERESFDADIAGNVLKSTWYRNSPALFTYLSIGSEVDTRKIILAAWACEKQVFAPRVIGGTRLMEWHAIESFDCLERSPFGIDEPPASRATLVEPARIAAFGESALALVPAYAFDAEGYRLGYGGGFYDEFLSTFTGVSMGLCRCIQMSPALLPRRSGDIAVDVVMTENGEWKLSR